MFGIFVLFMVFGFSGSLYAVYEESVIAKKENRKFSFTRMMKR